MKKSDTVMSKSVKNEVGFIFARGTAPVSVDGKVIQFRSQSNNSLIN